MIKEELKAIEERQERYLIVKYRDPQLSKATDDIAALLAGYKERDAEVKRWRGIVGASLDFTRHRLGCNKYNHGNCDCGYQEWSDRACVKPKVIQ